MNASRMVIDVAKNIDNMFLIGSAIEAKFVKVAIDELGPERVLFGSDTPFNKMADCIKDYEDMLAPYDEKVKAL